MQNTMTPRRPWRLLALLALCCCSWAAAAQFPAEETADRALYWAVSRDGQPAGYLLGTVHSEDPRVVDFPAAFVGELASNDLFAMEMVPDLPTLTRLTEYMHYPDGTTLQSRIGPERYARLLEALKGYRVPADWIGRMKVWAAVITLSVPPPKSGFFMDFSLSLRAAGAGLDVRGLETLEQQLSFLEEMPMSQQIALLDQALAEFAQVQQVHDELVDAYLGGDLEALQRASDEQLQGLDEATRRYFVEQGIEARNRRMYETLSQLLAEGTVFTAVGALHLPGPTGLIRLLREGGYELTPLPLPFSAAQRGGEADHEGQDEAADAP